MAKMDMDAGTVFGSYSKHFHDFPVRRSRRVVDSHSFGERAALEAPLDRFAPLSEFLWSGLAMIRCLNSRRAAGAQGRPGLSPGQHSNPGRNMANAHTKID